MSFGYPVVFVPARIETGHGPVFLLSLPHQLVHRAQQNGDALPPRFEDPPRRNGEPALHAVPYESVQIYRAARTDVRGLEQARAQLSGAGGDLPVNAVYGIAGLIGPNAGNLLRIERRSDGTVLLLVGPALVGPNRRGPFGKRGGEDQRSGLRER